MPRIHYVGRPSTTFYGKYLSEIARHLKNFGVGRVVVKEKELIDFKGTSHYTLTKVEPFMADKSGVRCRAWGKHVLCGKDMGEVLINNTFQPDWRLLQTNEAANLLAKENVTAPITQIPCVSRFPHLVESFLINAHPTKFSASKPPLMLLKPHEKDCLFAEPAPISPDEAERVWPPFEEQVKEGRIVKTKNKEKYFIRRTDYPGIFWKVELEPENSDNK